MKDLISFENIPESVKIGAGSMIVAEVLDKTAYEIITRKLSGVIFHTQINGKYFIKMPKKYYSLLGVEC